MKALLSNMVGGPETLVLTDMPTPQPGPGQVRVDVKACALNFPDTLIIQDKYQVKPPRPFAPGGEVAGIVSALGEGVSHVAVGDPVIALTGFGGLAEQVLIDAAHVVAVPPGSDLVEASTIMFAYGTTIHALKDRGQLHSGDTLLVLGAAGGCGIAAVELGKAFGARVVAAVSSQEKADVARAAGADDVVIYGRAPFDKDASRALAEAFKTAVGPKGANVIYDAVGGDYCEPALRSIAWEGRYLVIGFPAGIPRLPLNLTLLKSCDVRGVFWGAFVARDPQANAANVAQLFDLWGSGAIRPKITQTFSLADAGKGIAALGDRTAIGKVVVTI